MIRDELQRFIQYNEPYNNLCCELFDSLHFNETTVAAFTRCGTNTGTAFLSHNFKRVFGYARKLFIEGDLQFLINHIHPDDLSAFISFAETSTINATAWKHGKEKAVHEFCCWLKHSNGKWMWINQKVIVLSVTPDRHIDLALLLFDDCTAAKQLQQGEHTALIEKSRKKSKLLDLMAPVSNAQSEKEDLSIAQEDHVSLTAREKEIMQLVAHGFSSKEIATKLFISRHTVESHRKHILRKMSARNAPQMVHQSVFLAAE
jgi:DNA-binding CsgD family transcriptional regulator